MSWLDGSIAYELGGLEKLRIRQNSASWSWQLAELGKKWKLGCSIWSFCHFHGPLFQGNSVAKVFMKLICHNKMLNPLYSCICLLVFTPATLVGRDQHSHKLVITAVPTNLVGMVYFDKCGRGKHIHGRLSLQKSYCHIFYCPPLGSVTRTIARQGGLSISESKHG